MVEIHEQLGPFIAEYRPDVILLLLGISGDSPQQLNRLVADIFVSAPEIHLIVGQISPYATFNQNLLNYNDYIRESIIASYANRGYAI